MGGQEIITLISNNLTTIIPTVGTVTGGIFTAIFLRKRTASTEFEKIKAGQFKEVAEELLNSGKMTYTEYYKANNFLKVAEKANRIYNDIPHNEEPKEYNFDWFIRFYEAVGNISEENMQDLWAKILAGEINSPMSFSLKTIDVLKNLSKNDAELFNRICLHAISNNKNCFLPNYDEYLEHCEIKYNDIMKLSELGLMYNDGLITLNINLNSKLILVHEDYLLLRKNENVSSSKLSIKQFPLTVVGREILSLQYNIASKEDFMFFAEILKKETKIETSMHKIIKKDGDKIEYQEDDLIE